MLYEGPGELVEVFDGPNYGRLWDDRYPLAIVAHTTETKGLPDYDGGDSAPQVTIDSASQVVWQHQPLDRRGGALRGSTRVYNDTGVRAVMNEKAVHLEIIGYSDKNTVDKYGGGRRWVGDFTEAEYQFIAAVVHYLKDLHGIGDTIHARPAGESWTAGLSSPYRLGAKEWEQLAGFTAHGGIFGQTHWDTGVLDLNRIWTPTTNQGEEEDMRTADIVGRLRPADVRALCHAKTIGDRYVINPRTSNRDAETDYWTKLLATPESADWDGFIDEVRVAGLINSVAMPTGGSAGQLGAFQISLSGKGIPI